MTGWLLNLVYVVLIALLSPVLAYRAARQGKYRAGWQEKLWGRGAPRRSSGPCLWLHAVSVGEVLLLKSIIPPLKARRPDVEIWISTTTSTGHMVAREKFPDCPVLYFPLDFTWAVQRAIHRVRPDAIGLVELELWPSFIRAAARRGIPLVLINGRIGDRSFRGYRRIRCLMRSILRHFTVLAVQTPVYARRLIDLGAAPEQVVVTGSVKFDGVASGPDERARNELREAFGLRPSDRLMIAGSTHPPEEQTVLECYRRLRGSWPQLRLLLAPRHEQRFDEVARLIRSAGLHLLRRSATVEHNGRPFRTRSTVAAHPVPFGTANHPNLIECDEGRPANRLSREAAAAASPGVERIDDAPVILLDTLGELSACWGLAEVAFVGGSLSQRGGQNLLEPGAQGAAVVVGPNTWNFAHAVELLRAAGGVAVVRDVDELTATVSRLLADPDLARQMGAAARAVIAGQQGASARTVELLLRCLPAPVQCAAVRKAC